MSLDRTIEAVIESKLKRREIEGSPSWVQENDTFAKIYPRSAEIVRKYGPSAYTILTLMAADAKVTSSGFVYCMTSLSKLSEITGMSLNTVRKALRELEANGELFRYISHNKDSYYVITAPGFEKYNSEEVRAAFLKDAGVDVSELKEPVQQNCETPTSEGGGAISAPPNIAPPISEPRGSNKCTPNVQNMHPPNIDIEEEKTLEQLPLPVNDRAGSSRISNSYARTRTDARSPFIQESVLSLVSDSDRLQLTSKVKLYLLQLGGQVWIVNQAIHALDHYQDSIKTTPLNLLEKMIVRIRREAERTSPLTVRSWKPDTKSFRLQPGAATSLDERNIKPLPDNDFLWDRCNAAYVDFTEGSVPEEEVRHRFLLFGVDFDNFLRFKSEQQHLQAGG